jgi:integrase
VLAKAIEKANERLSTDEDRNAIEDAVLSPTSITPHSLRRTFASILFALGEPPPYVMAQMGHTTAEPTLAIYTRQMDRRDGEPDRLRALVDGRDVAEFRLINGREARETVADDTTAVEADR